MTEQSQLRPRNTRRATQRRDQKLRWYIPTVLTTLASGSVMMVGGYLFHRDGWGVAGSVMVPAGPLISIAFALARRANGRRPPAATTARFRSALLLVLGLPSPGGNLDTPTSIAVTTLSLLAGAVMAVAGYAAAAWNRLVLPAIIAAAGAVIVTAFITAARGDQRSNQAPIPNPTTPTGRNSVSPAVEHPRNSSDTYAQGIRRTAAHQVQN
ncbi:MAG TPA: hypothetical protein VMO88_01315 [Acidimicrobiales bacterium]|nr:hypothetical protein [Acidimicrobiales bacterium]